MEFKRIVSVLLVIMCILSLVSYVYAADISAIPGDTVEYTVSLSQSAVLAGFKVYLDYDTSVFSLAESDGEFLVTHGSFSTKGTIMANASTTGCSVLWYHTSNVTASGSLFTVTLNISENAVAGEYPVTLRYEADDTVNVEEENVSISLTGPSLVIEDTEPAEKAKIAVSSAEIVVGETITLPVSISNNPGFSGLAVELKKLEGIEFVGAKKGSLLQNNETGTLQVNPNTGVIHWTDSEDTIGDGEILLLEFKVSEICAAGQYNIVLSLKDGLALNFVDCMSDAIPVEFSVGILSVNDYLLGDVDDDGVITGGDAVLMSRHIVGLEKLTGKAFKAADIDSDGSITAADCVKMARYLVGIITSFK